MRADGLDVTCCLCLREIVPSILRSIGRARERVPLGEAHTSRTQSLCRHNRLERGNRCILPGRIFLRTSGAEERNYNPGDRSKDKSEDWKPRFKCSHAGTVMVGSLSTMNIYSSGYGYRLIITPVMPVIIRDVTSDYRLLRCLVPPLRDISPHVIHQRAARSLSH